MARKFGKKNIVKVDPLAYNIALLGEGGIGKSTLAYEMQEKLAGKDGYLHLNIGLEDGITALQGIIYEDVPNWETFDDIINDITLNKNTDYKDLRMITIDTIDELENIAIKEVIRLNNKKDPKNRVDSLNACFGGFGRGYEKLEEIILDSLQRLREVGVQVFIIGHVKKKTKTDPVTEKEYEVITAKMSNRIFGAIQTKLHVLGLAVIDRSIKDNIIGKDIMGKDIVSSKINAEKRVIKFRDDSFAVESKSRFANIVSEVEFSTDNFIKAITDAIESNFSSPAELEEIKKAQSKEFADRIEKATNSIQEKHNRESVYGTKEDLINKLKDFYKDSATDEQRNVIKDKLVEFNCTKFDALLDIDYENVLDIYKITEG